MGRPRSSRAFTLIEIMIVVAIIGIIIAIALPGFIRARERSRQTACQENLRKIDMAISQYILELNYEGDIDLNTAWGGDWASYLCGESSYIRFEPECPSTGTYKVSYPDDYEPVWCSFGTRDTGQYPHRMIHILDDVNAPPPKP